MPAVRDVISFGGQALAWPLLVLAIWAVVAAVAVALPRPRRPRRSARPQETLLASAA